MKLRQIQQIIYTIVIFAVITPANAILIGNMDWRQVHDTVGNSWNDIAAIFDPTTGMCTQPSCILGKTDLAGYVWADNVTVGTMIQEVTGARALPSFSQDSYVETTPDGLAPLFALFDITYSDDTANLIAGLTRESSHGPSYGDVISALEHTHPPPPSAYYGLYTFLERSGDYDNNTRGGWFYRAAPVPEPTTIFLLTTGLLGLVVTRRLRGK